MKPFSGGGEDSRKLALVTHLANETTGRQGPMTGDVMIKALSAVAIAAFIAAALTVLPGFAPQVEASVPAALAKADRLDIRGVGKDARSRPGRILKLPASARPAPRQWSLKPGWSPPTAPHKAPTTFSPDCLV